MCYVLTAASSRTINRSIIDLVSIYNFITTKTEPKKMKSRIIIVVVVVLSTVGAVMAWNSRLQNIVIRNTDDDRATAGFCMSRQMIFAWIVINAVPSILLFALLCGKILSALGSHATDKSTVVRSTVHCVVVAAAAAAATRIFTFLHFFNSARLLRAHFIVARVQSTSDVRDTKERIMYTIQHTNDLKSGEYVCVCFFVFQLLDFATAK